MVTQIVKTFGLLASLAVASMAASNNVYVVYNGNTGTNSDALEFIQARFDEANTGWKAVGVPVGKPVDFANAKAVVVLNSGVPRGVDRKLAEFVNADPAKSKTVMVSLWSGNADVKVQSVSPSAATLGLDGITAASVWKGKGLGAMFGGKVSSEYAMHQEWSRRLIEWIRKAK